MPVIASLVTSFANLSASLTRIPMHSRRKREVIGNWVKGNDVSKIALKVILMCSLSEGIGYIALPQSSRNEAVRIINIAFDMMYSLVKGLRGVFLIILYKHPVVEMYRKKQTTVRPRRRVESMSEVTATSVACDLNVNTIETAC